MIAELEAELKAKLPDGFPIMSGPENLTANDAPPRIVLIPSVDRYGPGEGGRDAEGRPLKALYTRNAGIRAHIWAEDYTTTEALLNEFIPFLREAVGPNLVLDRGGWLDGGDNDQDVSWLTEGRVYVLPFEIKAPVIKPETWTTIDAIASQCSGLYR